jgi:hypothetical protein
VKGPYLDGRKHSPNLMCPSFMKHTILRLAVKRQTSYEEALTYVLPFNAMFLNRRAAARYRALASIIPGRDRFSWKLSF